MLRNGSVVEWFERLLRRVSGGRIGGLDLTGLPTIRVTVRGRRTGVPHTAPCRRSANFQAADGVTVWRRGVRFTATVRLLSGAERDRAWRHILAQWPNYRLAQEQAPGREFRLFALLRIP